MILFDQFSGPNRVVDSVCVSEIRRSRLLVLVHGQKKQNVAEVVGATSSEGFLVGTYCLAVSRSHRRPSSMSPYGYDTHYGDRLMLFRKTK